MTVTYDCKFCHRPGSMDIDESELKDLDVHLETWVPILCCERCGAYEEGKRAILKQVLDFVRWWQCAGSKARESKKVDTRQTLDILTKDWVELVAEYFERPETWDGAIVDELMEAPDNAYATLMRALKMVRNQPAVHPELI